MLPKPSACVGCPFYSTGHGFVPDTIIDSSEVLIVMQNPGAHEEAGERFVGRSGGHDIYEPATPQPAIGKTGHYMDHVFLPQAGLERGQVSVANSIRCRYGKSDDLPLISSVIAREALKHCHQAHFKLPPKTKLIVAQGEYAMYSMTQEGTDKHNKLSDWRGYVLPFNPLPAPRVVASSIYTPTLEPRTIPVLVTYHIAYTFRDPTSGLITKRDWQKVRQLLNRTWPALLPRIVVGPPGVWPRVSAFDTEYVPGRQKKFICYSLYDGKTLRVCESLDGGVDYGGELPVVIMHNAVADLGFLEEIRAGFTFEDTMLAHAVLWSDFDHDLGFLGSLYGTLNRWKHLDKINPQLYSGADAFVTWQAWENHLRAELDRDPGSRDTYVIQKKLVPVIMAAEENGIAVNPVRAKEAYMERLNKVEILNRRAQAIAGWPINIRSNDQASHQLFEVERLMSLTGRKQ